MLRTTLTLSALLARKEACADVRLQGLLKQVCQLLRSAPTQIRVRWIHLKQES